MTLETGFVVQGHICTFVTRLYEATWLNVMYLRNSSPKSAHLLFPQAIQYVDEFISSSEQIWKNDITCSPMDPQQWMGAVRMRVQIADKNLTILCK